MKIIEVRNTIGSDTASVASHGVSVGRGQVFEVPVDIVVAGNAHKHSALGSTQFFYRLTAVLQRTPR